MGELLAAAAAALQNTPTAAPAKQKAATKKAGAKRAR
jgi:hypothetical protein